MRYGGDGGRLFPTEAEETRVKGLADWDFATQSRATRVSAAGSSVPGPSLASPQPAPCAQSGSQSHPAQVPPLTPGASPTGHVAELLVRGPGRFLPLRTVFVVAAALRRVLPSARASARSCHHSLGRFLHLISVYPDQRRG